MLFRSGAPFLLFGLAVSSPGFAASLPSLDEMSGDWMPLTIVTNPPDVHNFNQMLIVNRDLTSFFCFPGGLFARSKDLAVQWRAGFPLIRLSLDGIEYPAKEVRWSAYRALRRNLNCAGLEVETDTRMVNERSGILCRVTVTNPGQRSREIQLALRVPGELAGAGPGVLNARQNPRATSAVWPAQTPDRTTVKGEEVVWHWAIELPGGASTRLGFVAGDGPKNHAGQTQEAVKTWASHFDAQMAAFKSLWAQRWDEAFTPGNGHFSGNLPLLETDDPALRRNYYMGALTMLILERTQFPIRPAFITSGERADGIQYYWDASMQATAWALLEPRGMKAVLCRWLVQNPRGSPHISLRDTTGFDHRHYDAIAGYAANACTIFQTLDTYLRVSGDRGFLHHSLENGKTVLQTMDALAEDWTTLPKGPGGLVDYGGNGKLLETAPDYVECVASMNAQNIWMMRTDADWQDFEGHPQRAAELRRQAAEYLPRVLALYNANSGSWNLRRMDGATVSVRHCVDYIYVAEAIANDLTPRQRHDMNGFAKRELLTRDWMRAMSLKDPDVPRAVRPDHSYTGSYDGWIPLTVAAMWRLGDPREAYAFYCRTAEVTREGPFAQAHEFYGPDRTSDDAPVRVAMRGASMKECISGAAFADVVLNTFFGYRPSVSGDQLLEGAILPRPFSGTLENVRHGHALYAISADSFGLSLAMQSAAKD